MQITVRVTPQQCRITVAFSLQAHKGFRESSVAPITEQGKDVSLLLAVCGLMPNREQPGPSLELIRCTDCGTSVGQAADGCGTDSLGLVVGALAASHGTACSFASAHGRLISSLFVSVKIPMGPTLPLTLDAFQTWPCSYLQINNTPAGITRKTKLSSGKNLVLSVRRDCQHCCLT